MTELAVMASFAVVYVAIAGYLVGLLRRDRAQRDRIGER